MRIPRTKIVREAREITDARQQKVQNEKGRQDDGSRGIGGARRGEGRVDVSLSKDIIRLEEEQRNRVEELKRRYQKGEKIEFPAAKVASSVGNVIEEEILFGRLFGDQSERSDDNE
ncbi:hypothetical protein OAO01_02525 [Oligoflexia bacterium]|nr:hypothetical protein [Oligoflexia bacterium]